MEIGREQVGIRRDVAVLGSTTDLGSKKDIKPSKLAKSG